nr:MAG TPA: hypothetical protein [Caudoviricetes sp.]
MSNLLIFDVDQEICYKTYFFLCYCLRTREIFLSLYRSWETAHDFDF